MKKVHEQALSYGPVQSEHEDALAYLACCPGQMRFTPIYLYDTQQKSKEQ